MSVATFSPAPLREAGLTIIELIVFIVVLSIGITGILLVMNFTTSRSADPMLREQAKFIAEAYMEEILVKKFVDPTATQVCPLPPGNRSAYDNVCDYNGLANTGVRDQLNNPIAGLAAYNVNVTVANAGVTLNNIDNTGAVRVLRVDVTVTGPGDTSLTLTGYRTNYNCPAGSTSCAPL